MNNFFDILKDILTKKSGGNLYKEIEFRKHMSSYMLVRYLSMKTTLMPYAQVLNRYQTTLSPEDIYKWAYNNIPKQKQSFIKYISKKKKK